MATLTREDLSRIADACDFPYRWPDRTCCEIGLAVIRHVTGEALDVPALRWPEARAYAHIARMYEGRWMKYVREFLLGRDLAADASDEFRLGDFVEFKSPALARGDITDYGYCLGIATGQGNWAYAATYSGIVPAPVDEIGLHMRLKCLPS